VRRATLVEHSRLIVTSNDDRLTVANRKLYMKKWSLFQRRVSFLCDVFTETAIEVQPDKDEGVQNWPTPSLGLYCYQISKPA